MKLATLVLEDGTVLEGGAFGAEMDTVFELVFNTSMTGYPGDPQNGIKLS